MGALDRTVRILVRVCMVALSVLFWCTLLAVVAVGVIRGTNELELPPHLLVYVLMVGSALVLIVQLIMGCE